MGILRERSHGGQIVYVLFFYFLAILMYQLAGFGITAGAHRLWSHRAYKAKWPLRLFLTFCNTLAFEVSILLF